jgi:hypothetical protein
MADAARTIVEYEVFPEAARPFAVDLAAATPFRRSDALELLVHALDARKDADPNALAAREALHAMLHERVAIAEMWIDHGQPERGAELATRSGRGALAAHGWYAAGQFERAADAWDVIDVSEPDEDALRFGVGVNLLADRPGRAARIAHRLADRWSTPPATASDAQRAWYEGRAHDARCLAIALELRERHAAPSVIPYEDVLTNMSGACALLYADGLSGNDRVGALSVMRRVRARIHDEIPSAWFELLGAESDPTLFAPKTVPFESVAAAIAVPNRSALALALPAVERNLAEALLEQRASNKTWLSERASLASVERYASASAAVFAYLTGDAPSASRLARASDDAFATRARANMAPAVAALDALAATSLPQDLAPARVAIAWPPARAGEVHDAGGFLHGLLDFGSECSAGPIVDALVATPAPNEDEKEAWSIAAGGDGTGLAEWLSRPTSQPGTFLRFGAPFLGRGRTAVRRWVSWGYHPSVGFHPVEEVVHLATLADAAASLGPPDNAAPLRARATSFRDAILRRDTAVPLAVLDRL